MPVAYAQLTCTFNGMQSSPASIQSVTITSPNGAQGQPVLGAVIPTFFTFTATGGSGTYSWQNSQTVSDLTSIDGGPFASRSNPNDGSLGPYGQTGPVLLLNDNPGVGLFTLNGPNPANSVIRFFTFSLAVSVSSGGQTVSCGTVNWTAFIVVNKNPDGPSGGTFTIAGASGLISYQP